VVNNDILSLPNYLISLIGNDTGGYLTATRKGDFGIISLKKSFDYEKVSNLFHIF
jgi:hypothetical protein